MAHDLDFHVWNILPRRAAPWFKQSRMGDMLAKIYLSASQQPNNSFIVSVSADSSVNEELHARFKPLYKAYKFYSWTETLPTNSFGLVSTQHFVWM